MEAGATTVGMTAIEARPQLKEGCAVGTGLVLGSGGCARNRIVIATLRVVHIVAGAFWAGAAMLMGWYIAPTAREVGPPAGPFMQGLLKRNLTSTLIGAGVVTVGAGLWLFAIRMPTFARWQDWALAVGALAAIVALLIGVTMQRPTGKKMQELGAAIASGGGPPTPEQGAQMQGLQARMANYGNVIAILFTLALAGMALGGS